ncbi:helix-turn-helix domain-containing protein [Ensifer canadensis]|uniref:helix-turn-helix domain-containing protein n=1 Tax=Ensifer canadensis TaxID=555315 RepID=UPI0035E3E075
MSAKYDSKRAKTDVLIEEGTFNPTPEKVRDPKFRGSEFFDPHDAVQVKYEMLRRVSIDKVSVTEASDEYGVSRPTYYQAKVNFDMAGIAGLVPTKPGPRGPTRSTTRSWHFCRPSSLQENPFAPGNLPSCSARNSTSSFIPDRSSGF